jgi:hypothetical protein
MPSVANELIMQSVIMLHVVMLSVVVPEPLRVYPNPLPSYTFAQDLIRILEPITNFNVLVMYTMKLFLFIENNSSCSSQEVHINNLLTLDIFAIFVQLAYNLSNRVTDPLETSSILIYSKSHMGLCTQEFGGTPD